MFEGLIENLLKSILGRYIENVDSQKLSVSIWNGQISLSDLKIKSDIFQQFNLPFKLMLGIIKQLNFEIPWTRLSSSPVICNLDRLYLILTPQIESEWILKDTTSIEFKQSKLLEMLNKYIEEAKINFSQQISDEMEKMNKSQNQAKQQAGYFERYITRIKDNLRVQISNIHIRMEDRHSTHLKSFDFEVKSEFNNSCVGLILKELSLKTVRLKTITISNQNDDSSSDPEKNSKQNIISEIQTKENEDQSKQDYFFDATLKENQGKPIHKELSIKGLSIYIDSGPDVILLSFPIKIEEKSIESADSNAIKSQDINVDKLDKAMQILNENIFDECINWKPVQELLSENINNIVDWNSKQSQQIADDKMQDFVEMKKMNFIIRPQSILLQLTQNPEQAFSSGQVKKLQNCALYQLDIKITDLKLQLQKSQYLSIFRIADYMRKYQLKQEFLNRHKKYKQFRPIFPVLVKNNEIINQITQSKDPKNELNPDQQDQKEDMEFVDEGQQDEDDDSENEQIDAQDQNPNEKKLRLNEIGFDSAYESFENQLNGINIQNIVEIDKQIKKQQFNQLSQEAKNRTVLQRVETENFHAKSWWQYATTCVIKDNRQLSNSKSNQYQINTHKKKQINNVIGFYILQYFQSNFQQEEQQKKKKKKSKKKKQNQQSQSIDFRNNMEKYLFEYCIQVVTISEIEDQIKKIANQFLQDQIAKAILNLQKQQEEKKEMKQNQIDQNVKQGYGSTILSYINFWGGKSSQENEKEQRKQAEAAVEAITIAEQDLENQQNDNEETNFKECLEMDLETFEDSLPKQIIEEQHYAPKNKFYLQVRCDLDRGSIVLENMNAFESTMLFFQQINFKYQYHQGLQKIKVSTFNWGINNVKLSKFQNQDPVIKPLVQVFKKCNDDGPLNQYKFQNAWKFSLIIKNDELMQSENLNENPNEQSQISILFQAREILINYEPQIIQNFQKFLQIDETNDFKAHALDRIAQISEESQQNLRDIIQQQKVTNIDFKFEKITIQIPFKAQNSKYVNESEDQRERNWFLHLQDLQLNQMKNISIEQIYQKFNISVKSAGFQLTKRNYLYPLKVVEDLQINLLVEVKSKIKAKYMIEKFKKIKTLKLQEQNENQINPDSLPDIRITIANLNNIILNLTPDSYNSLVNITYVLLPESTKEEIIRQIKEKQKVIRESTFNKFLPVMGLKEYRLSNNWKNFFTVISGCYLYFYKQKEDLVPFHYLYIMSISIQEVNLSQFLNKEDKNSKGLTDCVLMIKVRNGEQIFINLGKTINKKVNGRLRANSISSSNSGGQIKQSNDQLEFQNKQQISDDQSCKSSQFSSSHQSDEGVDFNSKDLQNLIGANSKIMSERYGKSTLNELLKTQKNKQIILNQIFQKQQEFRISTEESVFNEDYQTQKLPGSTFQKQDSNFEIKNLKEDNLQETNQNEINKQFFSLSVCSDKIQVRVFKDDFDLMNNQQQDYQKNVWVQLFGEIISFETVVYPFEYESNLKIQKVNLKENFSIKKELIVLPDCLYVKINLWSINSPTIKDSEMEVKVDIQGKPIILFDPNFFNQLIKYFKNIQNQYFENYRDLQSELLNQEQFKIQTDNENQNEESSPLMRHTCENVETILLRTILSLNEGLTLICMHHKFLMCPFIELTVSFLSLRYDSMYDHDVLSIQMDNPDLFDLTMWPKTINPNFYQNLKFQSAQDFCRSLKKQKMIGEKFQIAEQLQSKITIDQTFFYENCPLYKQDCTQKCLIKFSNMSLFYYQEQFFRFISYLTNRFIYAVGDTDPYQEFQIQAQQLNHSQEQINLIDDLKQLDLQTDLKLELENVSIILRERPYLIQQWIELQIDLIEMTQNQFSVKKKHQSLPELEMKMLQFIYNFKNVQVFHYFNSDQDKKALSNIFNIELRMNMPAYSELLEKISSKLLDKSTNIDVVIHPQLKLNICQNTYTFIMRLNSLNICYYDGIHEHFDFTQVAEYFQSKDNILYMKTKIKIEQDIVIFLEQDNDQNVNKEIVEARLRSYQSNSMQSVQKEIIVMDQYLDGQFKINIFMGMPTLIYPSILENEELNQLPKDQNQFLKHLLVGTQCDPHIFEFDEDNHQLNYNQESGSPVQNLIDKFNQDEKQENNDKKDLQGKFFWKINYMTDGTQLMESRIEKAKIILKPYNFLKIIHFFVHGYPEYSDQVKDSDSIGEVPNLWQTDFEKLPEMKVKMEIKDSLICMDGFDTNELLEYKQNINFFRFQNNENPDESNYDISLYNYQIFQSIYNKSKVNHSLHVKNTGSLADDDMSFNQKNINNMQQQNQKNNRPNIGINTSKQKQVINFSTIACKTEYIEYTFKRSEIQKIKNKLFEQYKVFKKKLQENQEIKDQFEFENNDQNKKEDQASIEQYYLRMNLQIQGFSSYICNSIDLDESGFQDIQKRQLISPMDIKFTHQKFMKLLIPKEKQECKFNIFQINNLKLDKTLCKVTFCDTFILQQVSQQIYKSQASYNNYLAQYLLNIRQQDIIRLQNAKEDFTEKFEHEESNPEGVAAVKNTRQQMRKNSFHSFAPSENNSQKLLGSDADSELFYDFNPQEEENILKEQLNENLQQIRNNFVNYMTGFTTQKNKKKSSLGLSSLKFRGNSENSDQESQSIQDQENKSLSNDNTLIYRYKKRKIMPQAHSKSFGISQTNENYFIEKNVAIIKEEDQDKEDDFSIKHFQPEKELKDIIDSQFHSKNSSQFKKDMNNDQSAKVSEQQDSEQNQYFSIKENQIDSDQLKIIQPIQTTNFSQIQENQNSLRDIDSNINQEVKNEEDQINWEVDYGDQENFSSVKFSFQISVQGILLMIINDRDNIFYPILQMNLDQIKMNLDNNISNLRGETEIRARVNYFNNKIDAWEPFLESTVMRLVVEQDESTSSLHTCFKTPVNLNLTEEFIENLLNAFNDLVKSKKEEEQVIKQQQLVSEHRRQTLNAQNEKKQLKFSTIQISTQKTLVSEKEEKNKKNKVVIQNQQNHQNLEFKVAPFKLVNMTSKIIIVKRKVEQDEEQKETEKVKQTDLLQNSKHQRNIGRHGVQSRQGPQNKVNTIKIQPEQDFNQIDSQIQELPIKKIKQSQGQSKRKQLKQNKKTEIATTYKMEIGESVDYEVDYEQQATQILMTSIDDLIRKKNLIDIQFVDPKDQENVAIKDHNLVNLDQHIHYFSKQDFDFVLYGMTIDDSKLKKTFFIRNPFIIYNKTQQNYMVKIRVSRSKEQKLFLLAAGQNYPLSYKDLSSHIHFCLESDYYLDQNSSVEQQNDVFSSSFKLCNFYNREEIQKKKFFVYHKKKFSMIFIKPAKFNKAWDIILKTPLVIKNALPFGLFIKTKMIQDFKFSDNSYVSQNQQQKKDLIYEDNEIETLIKKQEKKCFQNFNLDEGINFSLTFEIPNRHRNSFSQSPYLMDWSPFNLSKKEYKQNDKVLDLFDVTTGQILSIGAKIKPTDETDLEITFYCFNCFINNTDQNIILWNNDNKKIQLPCMNESQIIPLSEQTQKIYASIENEDERQNEINQNDKFYQQGFPVNIVSLTSKITLMKQKDMYYDFILNTAMSLVTETDDIYVKITTINPQNVIVNQTDMILLFSQMGYHAKNAEVLLPKSRVPLYWTDIKGKQRIHFKVADQQQNQGFLETVYDWTKSINPHKLGTISITCRNLQDQTQSKHLRIIKRVNQSTQTTFIIVKIEEEQCPIYKIENLTQSIQLEYYQQGITPIQDCWRTFLPPGQSQVFSWIDPDPVKNFKGILCCNLNLYNKKDDKSIKTLQKLQIKLDDLKYKKKFAGKFIIDDTNNQIMTGDIIKQEGSIKKQLLQKRSSIYQIESQKYLQDQNQVFETDTVVLQDVQEKIIELKIVTNGYTNILKVSERMKNQQDETDQKNNDFHIKQIGQKKEIKQNGDLMEQIDDDLSQQNKSTNIEREIKVQIDISVMQISFIARNQKNQRCEFMLAYIQEVEFLQIDNNQDKCMQIKIADFQLDNNVQNQDGSSQIFPYIIYAKEVLNPKVQSSSIFRRKQAIRKDFFNLFVNMKKKNNDGDLLYIHKIQFLLQSLIIQIDDQTMDWIIRFFENFTKNLGSNITDVHYIFQSENDQIKKILKYKQSQYQDYESQNNEFRISGRDDIMNFDVNIFESQYFEEPSIQRSSYQLSKDRDSILQQQQYQNFPNKRNNVNYKYSSVIFTRKAFENHIMKSSDFWLKYDIEKSQNPIFIQELQMSPIDLEMSFRTRGLKNENLNMKSNILLRRLKQFRVNLYSFEKAPININSIQLSNVLGTPDEIISVLQIRYKHLIIKNILGIFSFLSSTNLLGNINLFFHDIGTGAKDFFYKPIEGFVDGPIEGGKGIVIGTASLLANTAKGGFGVVSRIANLFSKSILILAADDDFMDQRERKALDKPNNIVSGMAFGVESTVTGLASGLYGIVSKPVKGAKEGGIKGFFKGTAKGIGGVIAKPISGGFDFIAKTTEGAGNMMKMGGRQAKKEKGQIESRQLTASFAEHSDLNQSNITFEEQKQEQTKDNKQINDQLKYGDSLLQNKQSQIVQKIRIYRSFYGKNQRIKDYHEFQACVYQHLKMICDGEFYQDHFLDALIYDNGETQYCVILTEERVLIVDAETKLKINDFPTNTIQGIERRVKQRQPDCEEYDNGSNYFNDQENQFQEQIYELVVRVYKYPEKQQIFSSGKPKGLGISKININQIQLKKNIINIRGKLPGISCASKNNFFNDFDEIKDRKPKKRIINSPKFGLQEEQKQIDIEIDQETQTETQILERLQLNQTTDFQTNIKSAQELSIMIEDGFVFQIKDFHKFNAIFNKIQHYILYVLSLKNMHNQ